MDDMQMYHEKAAFVNEYLRPLCMRVDESLTEVEYMLYMLNDNKDFEAVQLKWENGHSELVNVTCDSLGALARDVLRAMQ